MNFFPFLFFFKGDGGLVEQFGSLSISGLPSTVLLTPVEPPLQLLNRAASIEETKSALISRYKLATDGSSRFRKVTEKDLVQLIACDGGPGIGKTTFLNAILSQAAAGFGADGENEKFASVMKSAVSIGISFNSYTGIVIAGARFEENADTALAARLLFAFYSKNKNSDAWKNFSAEHAKAVPVTFAAAVKQILGDIDKLDGPQSGQRCLLVCADELYKGVSTRLNGQSIGDAFDSFITLVGNTLVENPRLFLISSSISPDLTIRGATKSNRKVVRIALPSIPPEDVFKYYIQKHMLSFSAKLTKVFIEQLFMDCGGLPRLLHLTDQMLIKSEQKDNEYSYEELAKDVYVGDHSAKVKEFLANADVLIKSLVAIGLNRLVLMSDYDVCVQFGMLQEASPENDKMDPRMPFLMLYYLHQYLKTIRTDNTMAPVRQFFKMFASFVIRDNEAKLYQPTSLEVQTAIILEFRIWAYGQYRKHPARLVPFVPSPGATDAHPDSDLITITMRKILTSHGKCLPEFVDPDASNAYYDRALVLPEVLVKADFRNCVPNVNTYVIPTKSNNSAFDFLVNLDNSIGCFQSKFTDQSGNNLSNAKLDKDDIWNCVRLLVQDHEYLHTAIRQNKCALIFAMHRDVARPQETVEHHVVLTTFKEHLDKQVAKMSDERQKSVASAIVKNIVILDRACYLQFLGPTFSSRAEFRQKERPTVPATSGSAKDPSAPASGGATSSKPGRPFRSR